MGVEFTTSVGRVVQGDLWKGQTKDMDGNALTYKTGADAGKPRQNFFFALAIPKKGEPHWNQTPWGAIIYNAGVAGFPSAPQRPQFAWKVIDGDSQVPNERNKRPCDQEGFPGHWVMRFTGSFAPEIGILTGGTWRVLTDPNSVKTGDYVQVKGEVEYNGNQNKPGIYLNHRGVKFDHSGELIRSSGGFDGTSAGFSESSTAPAGIGTAGGFVPVPGAVSYTMTPKANNFTREQFLGNGWTDAQLLEQGMMVVAAQPPVAPMAPPVAMPPPVYQPHASFVAGATTPPPVAPAPMAPPVTAPVRQMTAAANGASYEQMVAAGWTDALLIQNGMMVG